MLQKMSGSVFLRQVAQTKTISLTFPGYELVWTHPIEADVLLLLDTTANPLLFRGDYTWLNNVETVEALPGQAKAFSKILNREVNEVTL